MNPTTPNMPNPTIDEQTHQCFGCGPDNPQGLHLHFADASDPTTGQPTATAQIELTQLHEGAPGYIHGGIIATLLDEAMSKLNRPLDALAVTRHMEIDYLRPAPLNRTLTLTARHLSRSGRKLFHQAELQSADGTILARAQALFIAINHDLTRVTAPTDPQPLR